jgi:hypothetical protein
VKKLEAKAAREGRWVDTTNLSTEELREWMRMHGLNTGTRQHSANEASHYCCLRVCASSLHLIGTTRNVGGLRYKFPAVDGPARFVTWCADAASWTVAAGIRRAYDSEVARRLPDPRPTLAAYGAPIKARFAPREDMRLEEAVVRALGLVDEDTSVLLVLPLVLVKNEERLDAGALLGLAREANVTAELGMFLDLTSELSGRQWFREVARELTPHEAPPRYYPEPRGGKHGRSLADERTPAVVRRWGFRMDASEEDLRHFLRKHLGLVPERHAR